LERDEWRQRYRAFLLRCWQVPDRRSGEAGAWRFCLLDVQTGEKHGFADLEALLVLLQAEFDANAEQARKDMGNGWR
jgi:hypothetical protein